MLAPVSSMLRSSCYRVRCGPSQYGVNCSSRFVDERDYCLGIEASNTDECLGQADMCGFGLLYNATTVLGGQDATQGPDLCSQALACFPLRAALYYGPGSVRMKPALTDKERESLCPLRYADVPSHLYFTRHPERSGYFAQTFATDAGSVLEVLLILTEIGHYDLVTNLSHHS